MEKYFYREDLKVSIMNHFNYEYLNYLHVKEVRFQDRNTRTTTSKLQINVGSMNTSCFFKEW